MRYTHNDHESDTTYEPYVSGPRPVLYDHLERPLTRPIGFRLDNRPRPAVNLRPPQRSAKGRT